MFVGFVVLYSLCVCGWAGVFVGIAGVCFRFVVGGVGSPGVFAQ